MRSALLIYRVNIKDNSNLGVVYKMQGQQAALEHLGYKVDFIIHDDAHIYKSGKTIGDIRNNIVSKFSFYNFINYSFLDNYDLYLFRYGLSTPSFIKCLTRTKEMNPTSRIIVDMPTYPYIKEWGGLKGKIALWIDQYYSSKMSRYVDYMIHSGTESFIYEVPTIRISNGINLQNIPRRIPKNNDEFTMIAVGKWNYWHGLDRILIGMRDFLASRQLKIALHIVGEGPERKKLERMTETLQLGGHVKFHGTLYGSAINELFNLAHVGIGTLALHRKNVTIDSSLKHREYMARGLPFVIAGRDADIEDDLPFIYYAVAEDKAIDISALYNRINNIDMHKTAVAMRLYAENKMTWVTKMDYLIKSIS